VFCTADDPQSTRGNVFTLPSVTGTATAEILQSRFSTQADGNIGPFSETGSPFVCGASLDSPPSAAGASLSAAFTALAQPALGDIVVTTVLVGQPATP
jgi:hypothetical protein